MVLHFLPRGPAHRVLLHGLAEEFEALKRNFDVLWPRPCALFDFSIEKLKRHLIRRFLCHIENEHSSEHLIKNHADRPDINLVTVTGPSAPICLNLLSWHHQRRSFE